MSHCGRCQVAFYDIPEDGCPRCGGAVVRGDLPLPPVEDDRELIAAVLAERHVIAGETAVLVAAGLKPEGPGKCALHALVNAGRVKAESFRRGGVRLTVYRWAA
jgi:hypothetical protein